MPARTTRVDRIPESPGAIEELDELLGERSRRDGTKIKHRHVNPRNRASGLTSFAKRVACQGHDGTQKQHRFSSVNIDVIR